MPKSSSSKQANQESSSSNTKDRIRIVYVVSVQKSGYKEDPGAPKIHLFKYEKKARKFMRETAKKGYYMMLEQEGLIEENMEPLDREKTPPRLRNDEFAGPFWYESADEITYGEDCELGVCYRRSWGSVYISKTQMDKTKE